MRGARYERWEDLVPNLEVGDILFINNVEFSSKLIKMFTRSFWSHVGIVFDIMHPDAENRIVLVIEAQTDRGIQVHRLRVYMNKLGIRRIGFKRVPGLTDEERERIKSFFLNTVDVPYDIGRIYTYFAKKWIVRLGGLRLLEWFTRRQTTVDNFLCSTYVQRAVYLASPPEKRDARIFRKGPRLNFLHQLEVVSPADIARSDACEWLWNPHA